MNKILILFIYLTITNLIFSQSTFYTPLEVQRAYKEGTRSSDGHPGEKYWQNHSKYKINVEIDTLNKQLIGNETIQYFNNSPDTLGQVVIRLYQDINKLGNPRDYDWPIDDINEGVNLLSLTVDNEQINELRELDRYGTNLYIPLKTELAPGKSINLEIKWSYYFSTDRPLRGSGIYGNNTYFISYWYPQIAVYDDISGWDDFEYTGFAEFYNDISDFEVEINVPNNFIVWGTGVLQNPENVLTKKYSKRYNNSLVSDDVIKIISEEDLKSQNITKNKDRNIWHFKADNISDFAFGTSSNYVWEQSSLLVEKNTNRRVIVCSAYDNKSNMLSKSIDITKKSLKYFSNDLPGIPYPYPIFTVFQGNTAMEYPMMANIQDYPKRREWLFTSTLIHEIAHTYFPFFIGTNERKYAFMDEGWAHMLPLKIQTAEIKKIRSDFDSRIMNNIWNYERYAGMEKYDKPPAVLTANTAGFDYHVSNHNRPGAAYYFLQDLLGENKFEEALQEYMKRWEGKHPVPTDFFNTFEDFLGEDLGWYWKPWFFEFGYPDLALKSLTVNNDNQIIEVEKIGNIPIPISLYIEYKDGSNKTIYKSAKIWEDNMNLVSITIDDSKDIQKIELGDSYIPDVDKSNNGITY